MIVDNKYVIDTGKEIICHCPFEKIRPKIELTGDAVLKLRYLQDKFHDVEFLVYGNATKVDNEDFSYILEDVTVPEQVVGLASIDDIKIDGNFNCVIHKHPGESTSHSSDDEETVDSNHDFSIVIGNDKKLKNSNGVASIKIDCGRYIKTNLDVEVTIPKSKNTEFIKLVEERIKVGLVEEQSGILSKIPIIGGAIGGAKNQNQYVCKRCKTQLEKTDKGNEWRCPKCEIKYTHLKEDQERL